MSHLKPGPMKLIWTDAFGSTYNEVIGRRVVKSFKYFNDTYSVGDIVEIFDIRDQEVAMMAEIVTAGSNMTVRSAKLTQKTSRRAIILKIIRHNGVGTYRSGDLFPAFLWGHDDRRMRHVPLETLARI